MVNVDYVVKGIVVGDTGVGKTSIIRRICHGDFDMDYKQTIGCDTDYFYCEDQYKRNVKVQFWDSGGNERFNDITQSYMRGVKFILFVYDISRRETIYNCLRWIQKSRGIVSDDVVLLILGNKSDQQWDISSSDLEEITHEYPIPHKQISAATGRKINTIRDYIVANIVNTYPRLTSYHTSTPIIPEKTNRCCIIQ